MVVGDVSSFPGHIACDGESRSEIVVPVVVGGEVGIFFFFPFFCGLGMVADFSVYGGSRLLRL